MDITGAPANVRRAGVPEKLGFTFDGTLRQAHVGMHDTPRAVMVWGMLADEFSASPAAKFQAAAFDARGRKLFSTAE